VKGLNPEDLAQKSIIRILGIVAEHEKIGITKLARESSLGHEPTDRYVKELKELGLVKDYYKGHNRYVEPNFRKVTLVFEKYEAFRTWVL
jgi:predicted transcriptional regulator